MGDAESNSTYALDAWQLCKNEVLRSGESYAKTDLSKRWYKEQQIWQPNHLRQSDFFIRQKTCKRFKIGSIKRVTQWSQPPLTWCTICLYRNMTSRQNKISIVSQGGLTSPKLFYQGPDFPNRSRKRWKERHVRISCINVTNTLSSVVIISPPNQLQYCRTRKISGSQVLQLCFTESLPICHVANMSRQVAIMFSIKCCRNVTVTQKPHQNRLKCHSCINTTDPTEGIRDPTEGIRDPTEGIRDPTEGIRDPTSEISHWPHRGNYVRWF